MFLSSITLISWGTDYPSIEIATLSPSLNQSRLSQTNVTVIPTGCPYDYEWCQYTPNINFYQYVASIFLNAIGYSIGNIMTFTIFSKLQPPSQPQGFMMGLLTSSGSLSRAIGPVVVTLVYENYGHRICFISLSVLMLLANVLIVSTFKRYRPYSIDIETN